MDANFDLTIYQGRPVLWGSLQETQDMQWVCQAVPFVVADLPPGTTAYKYDLLGRLTEVAFTTGTKRAFGFDLVGNRTSDVVTCGPGGC